MTVANPASAVFDSGHRFQGHDPNEGCAHHTVGDHRAWCLDCGEWCYPTMPCVRCERAIRERPLVRHDSFVTTPPIVPLMSGDAS